MNEIDFENYEPDVQPEEADLPHTEWQCSHCGFFNSCLDAECQNCDHHDEVVEVPCIDNTENHEFVVSDEDENICYCSRCGCMEY